MKTMQRRIPILGALLPLAFGTLACDDATGPTGTPTVSIRFAAVAPQAASAAYAPAAAAAAEPLVIQGSNGTLAVTGVHMIVSEFELDRVEMSCDDAVDEDACEKFEAPPTFVELPLTGQAALAVSQEIPPGTYSELDFEIEDLEIDDDDDNSKSAQIQALMSQIRAQFSDWPAKAAILVTGSFTPTGGEATEFRVYADAEIEIELAFDPHLVIDEASADKAVTVHIDPAVWFSLGDGTVRDLSQFDYDATGELMEFEVEIEDGFTQIEHEDDDD